MSSRTWPGLVIALTAAMWIAGAISLRPAGAANSVYMCDRGETLTIKEGRPVCISGTKMTDATDVTATSEAVKQKAESASTLFYFVLGIVSIALLGALVQFIGVGRFAWSRAKVANAIASAPDVPPANADAAERIISPESAAMIVQTSQSGVAIVVVVLLFFFGYLATIYGASFSPPVAPLSSSAPSAAEKPMPKPTATPTNKSASATIDRRHPKR